MKRTLSFLLALMICVSSLALFTFSASAATDKTVNAAWGTPTIDGAIDDVWENAPALNITVHSSTSAVVRVLNDAEYFYVLFDVTDSTVIQGQNDQVYISFDADNCGSTVNCTGKEYFNFGPFFTDTNEDGKADPSWHASFPNSKNLLKDYGYSVSTTGYICEFKIDRPKTSDEFNETVLIDFFVHDRTDSNDAHGGWGPNRKTIGWSSGSTTAYSMDYGSSTFGTLTFATETSGGNSGNAGDSGNSGNSGSTGVTSTTAWGTPTIDGTIDTVWSKAPALRMSIANTDVSAVVRVLNDDEYFYVLFDVTDTSKDTTKNDQVYISFDTDDCKGTVNCTGKEYFNLGPYFTADSETGKPGMSWSASFPNSKNYYVDHAVETTATGYVCEFKLFRPTKDGAVKENLLIDFFVHDRQLQGYGAWSSTSAPQAYNMNYGSATFGTITFSVNPNADQGGNSGNDNGNADTSDTLLSVGVVAVVAMAAGVLLAKSRKEN